MYDTEGEWVGKCAIVWMIVMVSFCGCVVVRSFSERVLMCIATVCCVFESRKSEYSECLKQQKQSLLDESVWVPAQGLSLDRWYVFPCVSMCLEHPMTWLWGLIWFSCEQTAENRCSKLQTRKRNTDQTLGYRPFLSEGIAKRHGSQPDTKCCDHPSQSYMSANTKRLWNNEKTVENYTIKLYTKKDQFVHNIRAHNVWNFRSHEANQKTQKCLLQRYIEHHQSSH